MQQIGFKVFFVVILSLQLILFGTLLYRQPARDWERVLNPLLTEIRSLQHQQSPVTEELHEVDSHLRETVSAAVKQELRELNANLAKLQPLFVEGERQQNDEVAESNAEYHGDPHGDEQDRQAHDQAVESSFAVLESALARGIWTRENNQTLEDAAIYLNDDDRIEFLECMGDAINSQQLRLEDPLAIPF